MHEIDGVLADVALVLERRRDVDRRIRDDQKLGIGRHVHDIDMADAAFGAKPRAAADDGTEQFVGMQAALHDRADLAGNRKLDGEGRCRMAVFGRHDLEAIDGNAGLFGGGADLRLRADQDRLQQAFVAYLDGRFDRFRRAGMDKRRLDHRQAARLGDDGVEAVVALQRDIGC